MTIPSIRYQEIDDDIQIEATNSEGQVTIRTTCKYGHVVILESVKNWFFSSDRDFCGKNFTTAHERAEEYRLHKRKVTRCEARVVKAEYLTISNHWLPIPED